MARFSCTSLPSGHVPPSPSGAAFGGPTDWIVTDDQSSDGDILCIDVPTPPDPVPGYKITNFEVAVSERNGSTAVSRVLGGPAVAYARRIQVATHATANRVQIRTVQQKLNQLSWFSDSPNYAPQVGDVILQASSGASTVVLAAPNTGASRTYYLVMGSISGTFIDQDTIMVNGNPGTQQSEVHCTHLDAQRVTLRSEW